MGDETISLRVGGDNIMFWTLSTDMADYSSESDSPGRVSVAFTNDGGDRDVQVDYVIIDGTILQAEDQSENMGGWGNG